MYVENHRESGTILLTSTPSRHQHHVGRTILFIVLGLVVVAALLGAGYAVTRRDKSAAPPVSTPSSAPASSAAPQTSAPAVTSVPFVALPVGTPPSVGVGEAVYPWHRLKARLHGPRQLATGTSGVFQVTISNPTSANVRLSPCPSYDVTVGYQTTSYGLNCAGTSAVIAPGASVTFDVPVRVPNSLSSGSRTEVSWALGWQPDAKSPRAHLTVTVK